MIWESTLAMTIIDVVIIAAVLMSGYTFYGYRHALRGLKIHVAIILILLGQVVFAGLYFMDLLIMMVFPFFMSANMAMTIMENLHLELMWITTLVGIMFFSIGFTLLIRDLLVNKQALEKIVAASKRSEAALWENEARLASITNNIPGGVYRRIQHADGTISYPYISEGFQLIFNLDPDAWMADSQYFFDRILPEDVDFTQESIRKSADTLGKYECEFRLIGESGGVTWCRSSAMPHRLEGGEIVWDGIAIDITEQKQAETALRESEDRLARAMAGTQDGLWDWNIVTGENYFSPRWLEILGYGQGDLETSQEVFLSLVHPEDKESLSKAKKAHLENHQPYHVEFRVRQKDGGYLWVRSKAQAEWNEQGKPLRMAGSIGDISLRKKAEEALRESEERLLLLTNAVPVMIAYIDSELRYRFSNREHAKWNGSTPDAILGRRVDEVLPPEGYQVVKPHVERALEGESVVFTGTIAYADGSTRDFHSVLIPDVDETGLVRGFSSMVEDITDRNRAEAALSESEERFRAVAENTPIPVMMARLEDGEYLYANPAANRLLAGENNDLVGQKSTSFWMDAGKRREMIERIRKEGKVVDMETHLRAHDGSVRWVLSTSGEISFQGEQVLMTGLVDVTDRKQIEAQMRLQAQIIEQTHECIITTDETGVITSWNAGAERLFGYTPMETVGKMTGVEMYPAQQQAFYREEVVALAVEKGNHSLEVIMQKKSGEEFYGILSLTILKNEKGEVIGRIGHTLDITDRKQAEDALRENEIKYRDLVETSQDLIWRIDQEGNFTYLNPAWEETLGFPLEKMIGKKFTDFKTRKEAERTLKVYKQTLKGREVKNYISTYLTKSGEVKILNFKAKPLFDKTDKVVGTQGTAYDITNLKHTEEELKRHRDQLEDLVRERTRELESAQEELVRKEKMAALGQLTATVSHELRNPLGTIRTSVFFIINKTSPDELGIGNALARIDRNVTRCDDIISDLLDFTRNRAPKPSFTDVSKWIAELMEEQRVPDWLKLKLNLAVKNRPVELDQEYIRRALINLYENALQAVEARHMDSQGKTPKITIGARIERKWLKISVKDTGPGMAQEVMDNIFEPLFSTKTYGVGLGLPTVRQIMELNGGTVSIKSELGKGTEAVLKLPLNSRLENEAVRPVS